MSEPQSIPERFDISINIIDFDASYNIAPGFSTPIVIKKDNKKKVKLMKWGLIPFWADDPKIGYKMINARSEGIENKPAFRLPIRKRRCLVPATGFYEWRTLTLEGKPEKFPWYFAVSDDDIFSFAGVYDIWKDAEGKEINSFSIITTDSNPLVQKVHNRMPVILNKKDEDKWLDDVVELKEMLQLLNAYPEDKMISFPVSQRVNNPSNDDKDLIEPVTPPTEDGSI